MIIRLVPRFKVLTWDVGGSSADFSMTTPEYLPQLVFALLRYKLDFGCKTPAN